MMNAFMFRLEILKYLTEYFITVIQNSPRNLIDAIYLCLNRVIGLLKYRSDLNMKARNWELVSRY